MAEPFLWGTATAAHQIEGGNERNDWWAFEQQPGRIAGGERSGAASDHWHRVAEDVGLMTALGSNAYRFSVEWSRVEPAEGGWDDAAWAHYVDEVAQLRAHGIEPMVTLLHFTLPAWLADRGGLLAGDFPERFARFAGEAALRLPDVRWWVTVNEPNVVMMLGYLEGVYPPAVRDPKQAVRAVVAQLRGHATAAAAVRDVLPQARIGLAHHLADLQPRHAANPLDRLVARTASQVFNWVFQDAVANGRIRLRVPGLPSLDVAAPELMGSTDFFGLNYYNRYLLSPALRSPARVGWEYGDGPKTDMGYEVYPAGFHRMITQAWQRYRLPVVVTENGVADDTEWVRPAALMWHVEAMRAAMAEGVPVLGYFYWSLLDNFEWAEGFGMRFGLYRVDYATQQRQWTAGCDAFRAYATGAR